MKPDDLGVHPRTSSVHAVMRDDPGPTAEECLGRTTHFREDMRHGGGSCHAVSDMLSRIGDKWTLVVVSYLGEGPMRFNEMRREIGNISQKMLTVTLRNLERDGFVTRTVTPTRPPQVEYALTEMGHCLLVPVTGLARWTLDNIARIEAARADYDDRDGAAAGK